MYFIKIAKVNLGLKKSSIPPICTSKSSVGDVQVTVCRTGREARMPLTSPGDQSGRDSLLPPGPDSVLPCSQRLVESRRQQILKEFEELHRRLDEEQQTLLSRLEEEEQDILQRLRENAAHLGDKRRDLAHLAAEVEGKCLQSGFEMLKVRLCPCVGPRVRCSLALCRPTCQSEVYPLLLCFPKPRFLFQMCAKNLFLEWGTSDFHHPLKKLLYP